jgi:hypothetical protein
VYQGVEPSHENWELLPANLGSTAVHYVDNEGQHVHHLQRMVTLSLEAIRREAFLSSGVCSELDLIRIRACKQKCASFWLIYPNPYLTEQQVKLIVRIRAGLPPVDDRLPTHCVCKEKFLLSRDPIMPSHAQDSSADLLTLDTICVKISSQLLHVAIPV